MNKENHLCLHVLKKLASGYLKFFVWYFIHYPVTLFSSSSQVGIVESKDFDVSQTHILYLWCGRTLLVFCAYVEPMSLHVHEHTHCNSDSPLEHSLPETRVHYCSLTSASSLTTTGFSPSVTFFVFCCHCMMCVCEQRTCGKFAAVPCFCVCVGQCFECIIMTQLSPVPQIVKCVRVWIRICAVSCWGYMCGAVCPPGFSPQWPPMRLSQRETEREKEGERVPLLSPHTHTLIIILLSGN